MVCLLLGTSAPREATLEEKRRELRMALFVYDSGKPGRNGYQKI
jgi:hypothetical protein